MDDSILVERFRHGDEGAFNQLVERHKREAYAIAYRLTGNHEDARDLSQESFLRCYQSIDSFRGDASFRTWLFRIVVNVSLNFLKSIRFQNRRVQDGDELEHIPDRHPGNDPAEQAILSQRAALLRASIDRLPPKQRQTLILKIYGELKYDQIAEMMGCAVGTAKANFFHALKALREIVGDSMH